MIVELDGAPPTCTNPRPPAKKFPFELDQFQKQAIQLIDAGQSVMVAAHTSAGKTSVAEYAIATALRDQHRVIYTSPIKALSNQKYRELQMEFGNDNVGLKTGDLSINPEAACLVMTTEILRNMLYRGAEELQEVQWIVFDEIHYMRDRERGVVWEEAIILCPSTIRMVFLSATLSNAEQFAGWITQVTGSPCDVIQTMTRPTPLHHYVFVKGGGEGIYLIADPSTKFSDDNYNLAVSRSTAVTDQGKDSGIFRLFYMLTQQNYYPAIVFSFSRRECEAHALMLQKLSMNTEEEQGLVQTVFDNALASLSEEDQRLPQALKLLPLLKQGVGVHHGGMLPILKEVVELLFQESLVKVLCATETFALGVNMPAKTVIFTAINKFDGKSRRQISSSEYIQMSGRAGRRGRDPFGLCILMIDANEKKESVASLVDDHTDPLISQFRLSYNSILNMTRSELHNPDLLLMKSFHAYLDAAAHDVLEKQVIQLTRESQDIIDRLNEKDQDRFNKVQDYYRIDKTIRDIRQELEAVIHAPENCLRFLQPGRAVYIKTIDSSSEVERVYEYGWGIVMGYRKLFAPGTYIVDILVQCTMFDGIPMPSSATSSESHIARFHLDSIKRISSIRMLLPNELIQPSSQRSLMQQLNKTISCSAGRDIDPLLHMDMSNDNRSAYMTNATRMDKCISALKSTSSSPDSDMALYRNYIKIGEQIEELKAKISDNSVANFRIELKNRLRLLRRLQYVDNDGLILQKGRIACEIDSLDELVCTELIVDGIFQGLDEAETAALVTCLHTDQEKRGPPVPKELETQFNRIKVTARRIGELAAESSMPIDVEEYVGQFTGTMSSIVLEWARGKSFEELCKSTTIFEGSIIRTLRRLQEVLVQLADGAQSIGNDALHEQFERARRSIHRGIPFAGSLYL